MSCHQIRAELVNYHKDELDPEARARVERHLRGCLDCAQESLSVEETFAVLRKELVPIELSAHFRVALKERMEESTRMAEQARIGYKTSRASERHLREERKPTVLRLWDYGRRSPYFIASVALHAAVVLLVVGLLVHINNTRPAPRPAPALGEEPVFGVDMSFSQVYAPRKNAPSVRVDARAVEVGVRVDIAQFAMVDTLVLVGSPQLGAVMAYFADAQGYPSSAELRQRFPSAQVQSVENAAVVVPTALAQTFFGNDLALRVFHMDAHNRLEFWREAHWRDVVEDVGAEFTRQRELPRVPYPKVAVLPKPVRRAREA